MCEETIRKDYLSNILNSKSEKRLIVAGPGTGKTFTFTEIINQNPSDRYLVMTFINKLVDDLKSQLGDQADVKTFHSFCIENLHKIIGDFEISPVLTNIVKTDFSIFHDKKPNFEFIFQTLAKKEDEISFFFKCSRYYNVVSFDDSVYFLLTLLKQNKASINYDLILIDEYQDFNPLEVDLINKLSESNNILIIGDDDQAIYSGRNSSPVHLRELYKNEDYDFFELPYCSRCPKVIIDAVNSFIDEIQSLDTFNDRIDKKFLPYLTGKEYENSTYSKIIKAKVPTAKTFGKYILNEIRTIPTQDIGDSYLNSYPTILIIGQTHYLKEIEKSFRKDGLRFSSQFSATQLATEIQYYQFFLENEKSNFSWRLLIELYYNETKITEILTKANYETHLVDILDKEFVNSQKKVRDILIELYKEKSTSEENVTLLKRILGSYFSNIYDYFKKPEDDNKTVIDKSKPNILLTTFEGSKGLSGGHIFIVGCHNGSMPKIRKDKISDIEISKFIVALTRTRKQCHLVTNNWFMNPKDSNGKWLPKFEESYFLSLLPKEIIEDKGYLKSSDL